MCVILDAELDRLLVWCCSPVHLSSLEGRDEQADHSETISDWGTWLPKPLWSSGLLFESLHYLPLFTVCFRCSAGGVLCFPSFVSGSPSASWNLEGWGMPPSPVLHTQPELAPSCLPWVLLTLMICCSVLMATWAAAACSFPPFLLAAGGLVFVLLPFIFSSLASLFGKP